jgi:hypothetical protein
VEVMNTAWADSLLASYKADAEGPERASLPEAALGELVAAWDRGQAANDTAMGRFLTWVCPTAGGGAQDAGNRARWAAREARKAVAQTKRAAKTAKRSGKRPPTPSKQPGRLRSGSRPTAANRNAAENKRRAEKADQANKELTEQVRTLEQQLLKLAAKSAEASSLAAEADAATKTLRVHNAGLRQANRELAHAKRMAEATAAQTNVERAVRKERRRLSDRERRLATVRAEVAAMSGRRKGHQRAEAAKATADKLKSLLSVSRKKSEQWEQHSAAQEGELADLLAHVTALKAELQESLTAQAEHVAHDALIAALKEREAKALSATKGGLRKPADSFPSDVKVAALRMLLVGVDASQVPQLLAICADLFAPGACLDGSWVPGERQVQRWRGAAALLSDIRALTLLLDEGAERVTAHTDGSTKGMLSLGNLVMDVTVRDEANELAHHQVCLGGAFPSLGTAQDVADAVIEYALTDAEARAESLRTFLKKKGLDASFLPEFIPVSGSETTLCCVPISTPALTHTQPNPTTLRRVRC